MKKAVLAGLVAALVGAALGLLSQRDPPVDRAALLVPADALVYAQLATDRDDELLETLEKLPTFTALRATATAAVSRTAGAFDFERDVEPWLGDEAAVALLDTGEAAADTLILLSVDDEPKAQGLLSRVAGAQTGVDYKGTAVRRFGSVAAAFVGGYLALGQETRVKAAIDLHRADGARSLANSDAYRRATEQRSEDRVLDVVVSPAGVRRVLRAQPGLPGAIGGLLDHPALAGVSLSLWAVDGGLRVDARQARRTGRRETFTPNLLDSVPDDAGAYLGLQSLAPLAPLLARLQAALGELEIGPDLLEPLRGEVAFSITAGLPTPLVTLAATTRDEARTRDAMARLQSAIVDALSPGEEEEPESGSVATFQERRIGDVDAFVLTLAPGAEIVYAVFDGKLVITTGAAGIQRVRRGGDSLRDDARFERALGDPPSDAEALLFLDLAQLLTLGEQAGLTGTPAIQGAREDLRRMRVLGAAVKSDGADTTAELFLEIP